LTFQFADAGQVLADLQASEVVSIGVPYRKIANKNEFVTQLDPEFGRIP
jgi:hypothetical protein